MELICHQLRKVYPDGTEALQSIDLQTGSGLLGLLGPNGAGKTTLMEILTLLLEPTSGTVSFGGIDFRKQMRQLRPLIGYLPQFFGYFPELTAREFLHYLSTLRGISGQDADRQVKELLFAVRLQDVANRRLKTYSGGMLRRVGIAQALLGDPKLIVVDEPTAGLDPEERVNFRNLLFDLSEGRTVLLSTHIVKDIEDTCTNMALMLNGQIQFHGNTTEFIRSAQEDTWEFWGVPQDMERYSGKTNLVSIREEDRGVCFRIIAPEPPVESAQRVQPNLEDAYVRYLETQKPAA